MSSINSTATSCACSIVKVCIFPGGLGKAFFRLIQYYQIKYCKCEESVIFLFNETAQPV